MLNRRYSFTNTGLMSIGLAGLTPEQVWTALHGQTIWWPHGAEAGTEYGEIDGLILAIGLQEGDDDDWDIVGARRAEPNEIDRYTKQMKEKP